MVKRFAQPWRFGGPGRPAIPFSTIRGERFVSFDLVWPAVVWKNGRLWVCPHDLTPLGREVAMAAFSDAELVDDWLNAHGRLARIAQSSHKADSK